MSRVVLSRRPQNHGCRIQRASQIRLSVKLNYRPYYEGVILRPPVKSSLESATHPAFRHSCLSRLFWKSHFWREMGKLDYIQQYSGAMPGSVLRNDLEGTQGTVHSIGDLNRDWQHEKAITFVLVLSFWSDEWLLLIDAICDSVDCFYLAGVGAVQSQWSSSFH